MRHTLSISVLLVLVSAASLAVDQKAYPTEDVGGKIWQSSPATGANYPKVDEYSCTSGEYPCSADADYIYTTLASTAQTFQIGLPPMRGAYASGLVRVTLRGKAGNSFDSANLVYIVKDAQSVTLSSGTLVLPRTGFSNFVVLSDTPITRSRLPITVQVSTEASCEVVPPDSSCNVLVSTVEVEYRGITTTTYVVN